MKTLALAVLLASLSSAPTDIAWKPRAGTKLERTFALETSMHAEEFALRIDGEDVSDEDAGEPTLVTKSTERYVFVDEIASIGEGRPKLLRRTYEELEQNDETTSGEGGESDTETTEYASDLEGKTVSFTWDDESDAWKRAFEGDEKGDEELLAKLEEDLDLRAVLPEKAIEVGASWDVDPKALDLVFLPGGDLGMKGEDTEDDTSEFDRKLDEVLDANLKGTLRAKLAAVREIDGVRCAVIEIEGELETAGEFDDDDAGHVSIETQLEPRGEIVWDLEANHLRSAEIEGALAAKMSTRQSGEFDGESFSIEQDIEFAGSLKLVIGVATR